MRLKIWQSCLIAVAVGLGDAGLLQAQDYFYTPRRRIYSALDAGLDAYQFHDAVRREQIAHQMDLNNQMLLNAYPRHYDPFGPDPFAAPIDPDEIWDYPYSPPAYSYSYPSRPTHKSVQVGPNRIYYRVRPKVEELPVPRPEHPHPRDSGPREF